MTTQQPEALIFANDRPSEIGDDLYQWVNDAEEMIRRQHARIVELEKENSYLNDACAELEAQLCVSKPPISDELPQGFISDVLTAAGLVRHGKQCKALADRLGDAIQEIWTTSITQRKATNATPNPLRPVLQAQHAPMLFNPFNGKPRHPLDVQSDPYGLLITEPNAEVRAAPITKQKKP